MQNKFIFSVGERSLKDSLSYELGEHEVDELVDAESFDGKDHNRVSRSSRKVKRRVVLPDEIEHLKDGEFYLKLESYDPIKSYIPFKNWPIKNKPLDYHIVSKSIGATEHENLKDSPDEHGDEFENEKQVKESDPRRDFFSVIDRRNAAIERGSVC